MTEQTHSRKNLKIKSQTQIFCSPFHRETTSLTSPHLIVYGRINEKVRIFLQIFRDAEDRNPVHKQDAREGTQPASAALHKLYMGEKSSYFCAFISLINKPLEVENHIPGKRL